jgi:hypothetical protein
VATERYFTPDEANDLLDEVRPLAEQMVDHRRRQLAATAKRALLVAQIQGNGGGLTPSDMAELEAEIETHASGLERCVAELVGLGVQVKDVDKGLVDFPAVHEGGEILLCWHVGEESVEYWHSLEEGFAGRKPIDLLND